MHAYPQIQMTDARLETTASTLRLHAVRIERVGICVCVSVCRHVYRSTHLCVGRHVRRRQQAVTGRRTSFTHIDLVLARIYEQFGTAARPLRMDLLEGGALKMALAVDGRAREEVEAAVQELILETKCPICLDFFTNPRSAPCQHNFCEVLIGPMAHTPHQPAFVCLPYSSYAHVCVHVRYARGMRRDENVISSRGF